MENFWRDIQASTRTYLALPLPRLAIFPLMTIIVLTLGWVGIAYKIHDAKSQAIDESFHHAEDVAHTFDQYTSRSIRQVDQITRFIAFESKNHKTMPPLQSLTDNVLVSPAAPVLISLADQNGNVYASSKPFDSPLSIADREHFMVPATSHNDKLFVGKPVLGRVSGKWTIQISRRITHTDGSLAGVVIVSMAPSVLNAFYNKEDVGSHGFIGVSGTDGIYRASLSGMTPSFGQKVNPAILKTLSGRIFLTKDETIDHIARFVAWRHVEGYDLVSVVGLAEDEVLHNYYKMRNNWKRTGIIGTILIIAFGIVATIVYGRLEWRRLMVLQAKEAYRTASEGTNDGFFIIEPLYSVKNRIVDFVITDANDKGAYMFSIEADNLIGTYLSSWFKDEMASHLLYQYTQVLTTGRLVEQSEVYLDCESPLQGKWLSHRAVPTSLGVAITVRDITQAKDHEKSMLWLANHDAVTKLHNRMWLQTHLPDMLDKASKKGHIVALYFIDLDDFKKVNDTLGHAAGDTLLSIIGDKLIHISRTNDIVCRLGGDEFTLVVQGDLSHETLTHVGERILDVLKMPITLEGQVINIGASVGVSCFPEHGDNADQLLKRADLAMYKAKDSGKGICEFFLPALSLEADNKLQLEREMRQAIDNDELYLVYQPKVDLMNKNLVGMEALVRWKSTKRGVINPNDFIPLAEKTGLILPIGKEVLKQTCEQIIHWQSLGYTVPPVSVNVSPKQLQRTHFADEFQDYLIHYGLPENAIDIEITESSMMEESDLLKENLHKLKLMGVKILVDDFGTGYSSLSLLKRFEIDVLKIDRSFVKDIPEDSGDCALAQAVVSMAHSLNMGVIAEGVETLAQWEFLKSIGCAEAQGYYFSRPIVAQDMHVWLDGTINI